MTPFVIDGFDDYATADLPGEGWQISGSPAINGTAGRGGGGALITSAATDKFERSLGGTTASYFQVGFRFAADSLPSGDYMLTLAEGTTSHLTLRIAASGAVEICRSTTLLGTSSEVLIADVPVYIEFRGFVSNSGSYELRFDGVVVASSSGVDTQNGGSAAVDRIVYNGTASSSSNGIAATCIWDDIVALYGTSFDTAFFGPGRADTLLPNGNGNSSDCVGSDADSTDNYLHVDDAAPDGDTSYVQSTTVGDIDTYALGNMPFSPAAIHAVSVIAVAKASDAGAKGMDVVTRIGSTNYNSSEFALGGSYVAREHIRLTSPATSSAWTKSEIDAMEVGIEDAS